MKWWKSQRMLQTEHLTVKSDLTLLNQVLDWFDKFCFQNLLKFSWLAKELDALKLALTEGFTNAVRHAHKNLPLETPIELELILWNDRLEIKVWDYGGYFDPNTIPEPEPGKPQENGGYGWYLIRRIVDEAIYKRYPDSRNCLILIKYKNYKK